MTDRCVRPSSPIEIVTRHISQKESFLATQLFKPLLTFTEDGDSGISPLTFKWSMFGKLLFLSNRLVEETEKAIRVRGVKILKILLYVLSALWLK